MKEQQQQQQQQQQQLDLETWRRFHIEIGQKGNNTTQEEVAKSTPLRTDE